MSWSDAVLQELVIPQDATDGQPRIEIGSGNLYGQNPASIRYQPGGVAYFADEVTVNGGDDTLTRFFYIPGTGYSATTDYIRRNQSTGDMRRVTRAISTVPGGGNGDLLLTGLAAGDSTATLQSRRTAVTGYSTLALTAGDAQTPGTITVTGAIVHNGDPVYISRRVARGFTAASTAVTTTPAVMLAVPSATYLAGHLYEVRSVCSVNVSANTAPAPIVAWEVRKGTTTAGATACVLGRTPGNLIGLPTVANTTGQFQVGGGAVTTALSLVATTTTGTTASAVPSSGAPSRYIEIWDLGPATADDSTTLFLT